MALQQLSNDYDALQREQEKALDNEKRAQADLERARTELNAVQMTNQETAHQLNNEINNLRRELQEHRNKAKIVLESKTRMEMELINLRTESGNMAMDAHKQAVLIKESEAAQKSLEDSLDASKLQVSTLTENCGRLKNAIAELEDGMQRKNATIEGLKEEMVQLERDSHQELRRMR
jgi:chromosome segregation ATPase